MLERARARQEKIDQKLVSSGQTPKRKPLAENVKSGNSPIKSPNKISRDAILSPKKSLKESNGQSPRKTVQKDPLSDASPQRGRNDYIVTKKEFKSPRGSRGSANRRNSDVSVEINIMHRNDIQIEVQVEERDAPISIEYSNTDTRGNVMIQEIEGEKRNINVTATIMATFRPEAILYDTIRNYQCERDTKIFSYHFPLNLVM